MIFNNPLKKRWYGKDQLIGKGLKFHNADTREDYHKHLREFGNRWRYSNKEIIYSYNELGYRTEELDYYRDKEFILVMGCSHTEGIALAEDEVWHYPLRKQFGVEILNAGVAGSGTDIQLMNSMLFLKNYNVRPKAVVIQWPNLSRFEYKGEHLAMNLMPVLVDNPFNDTTYEFDRMMKFYKVWISDNNDLTHSQIFIETTRLMWKFANIPYYDFSIDSVSEKANELVLDCYNDQLCDRARDLLHYGYESHFKVSQKVCDKLKNML